MWTDGDEADTVLKNLECACVCTHACRQTDRRVCFVPLAEIARAHGALMTPRLKAGALRCDCYGNGLLVRDLSSGCVESFS